MARTIQLCGGPHNGNQLDRPLDTAAPGVALPVDQFGEKTNDPPFALALYLQGDNPDQFHFAEIRAFPNRLFSIDFADGPARGHHPAPQPAQYLDDPQEVALDSDGSLYQGKGKIGGAAIYRRKRNGSQWRFHLEHIDRSEGRIRQFENELREQVIAEKIEEFYRNPDYGIYSVPPVNDHPQVVVAYGHRRAEVDEKIAPVIELVWQLDLDTIGSCQERPPNMKNPGNAYVGFWREEQARIFERILKTAMVDCKCYVQKRGFRQLAPDGTELRSLEFNEGSVHFAPVEIDRIVAVLRAAVEALRHDGPEAGG